MSNSEYVEYYWLPVTQHDRLMVLDLCWQVHVIHQVSLAGISRVQRVGGVSWDQGSTK